MECTVIVFRSSSVTQPAVYMSHEPSLLGLSDHSLPLCDAISAHMMSSTGPQVAKIISALFNIRKAHQPASHCVNRWVKHREDRGPLLLRVVS